MQRRAVPVVSDGGWSSLRNNRRRFHSFELVLQAEQAPAPNNRVILGDTKDEFGLPRPRVVSNWSDIDIVSIRKTTRILALEFERAGIGRFIPDDEGGSPQLYQLGGAHHHMGTTRMHTDPKEGVTDENGRLHGLQNVFVAGSSLFPTGGYANPTLTLLALALRLADHLKARRA
jgi:choline dehydrogenase-like flavoprotein